MRSLEYYRGRDFIGVEELTQAAATLIERYSPEPERGNVRLTITPRIVRHYLSENLLGEPTGQSGTSIVFNYGNLLRLLAVKKLLAHHWSLIKIREFMHALDLTALEQLISKNSTASNSSNKSALIKAEAERGHEQHSLGGQTRLRAASLFSQDSLPHASSKPQLNAPPPLAALAIESAQRAERDFSEWIEIAVGLEIKVRRSFQPPRNARERKLLTDRFWTMLKNK
jgi:DNA-binding transcriptional MerR regulator